MIAKSPKPFIYLVIFCVTVAGCSSQPRSTGEVIFATDGKLSVRNGNQGRSGRFSFVQYADSIALEVWGPLGQGRVRLAGNEDLLTLSRGNEILTQADAASLMQEQLGWYVPLAVFSAWLRGAPNEDYPVQWLEQSESGSNFRQLNWQVTLSRFGPSEAVSQLQQPGRIKAEKGSLRILLVTRS